MYAIKAAKLPTLFCYTYIYRFLPVSVTVRFAQEIYTVSEAVGSQNLALYVCVTASTVERSFSVTLQLTSGTAVGNYVVNVMITINAVIDF